MNFGVEIDFSQTSVEELSDKFDRRENSPYLKDGGVIDLAKLRSEVSSFLNHLNTIQKLKSTQNKKQVAIAALCITEEIRFTASLEGDKIGGFSLSSMTPGKQALFALTLILDESDDAGPLPFLAPEGPCLSSMGMKGAPPAGGVYELVVGKQGKKEYPYLDKKNRSTREETHKWKRTSRYERYWAKRWKRS